MIWDLEKEPAEGEADNGTVKTETLKPGELRNWFISLSDLRGKERSLLHGDYYSLSSSDTSLAFLRLWDQSERYITAVNWGTAPETLAFKLATPGECRDMWFMCICCGGRGSLTPRLCPRRSEIARDGQSEAVDRRRLKRRVRRQPGEANSGSGESGPSAVPLQRLKMATNGRKFKMMLKIGPSVLQKSDLPLQFQLFLFGF